MRNFQKAMFVVLVIGIAVSIYVSYVHFQPSALYCPNAGIIDCEQVLSSGYSAVLGVPIAFTSVIWFVVLALFTFSKKLSKLRIARDIWLIIGLGGLLYSVVAMHLIGKICIYCSTLDVMIVAAVLIHVLMKDR